MENAHYSGSYRKDPKTGERKLVSEQKLPEGGDRARDASGVALNGKDEALAALQPKPTKPAPAARANAGISPPAAPRNDAE